jgi:hypothetical protein
MDETSFAVQAHLGQNEFGESKDLRTSKGSYTAVDHQLNNSIIFLTVKDRSRAKGQGPLIVRT